MRTIALLVATASAQELLEYTRSNLQWTTACYTRPFDTRVIANPQDPRVLSRYDNSGPAREGVKIRQGRYCSFGPTYEALTALGEIQHFDSPWTMVIETSFPGPELQNVYLQFIDRSADGTASNPSCNSYGQGQGMGHLYFPVGNDGVSRGLVGSLPGNRWEPVILGSTRRNSWNALYHYDTANLAYRGAVKAIEPSMLRICPTCTRPSRFQFVVRRTSDQRYNVKMYVEEGTPQDEIDETLGTYVLKLEVESVGQLSHYYQGNRYGGVPVSFYLNNMRQDMFSWRATEGNNWPIGGGGDPHLTLPHGGRADFRGTHKTLYNFLSAKNVALNVMTELADFELHEANHTRHKDVHGSFLTQAHVVMRTNTSKIVRVSFWADKIKPRWNVDGYPVNLGWANGTVDADPAFVLQPSSNPERSQKQVDDVKLQMDFSSLYVLNPEFEIIVTPRAFRLERNVVGLHHRLDLQIKPRVAEVAFNVPPHGIIGQGWDGDGKAIDGEQDIFPERGEFTTYSMARGAIEGTEKDYRVAAPYAIDFKYSRFDATSAKPRDVSKLVAAGELNTPKIVKGGEAVGSTELTEDHM